MYAKIYRPAKTAMQSGRAGTKEWVLEFEPETAPRSIDPLMGWTRLSDMREEVRMEFNTREAAVEFAKRNKIPHRVVEPREPRRVIKSSGSNFASGRKRPWTH